MFQTIEICLFPTIYTKDYKLMAGIDMAKSVEKKSYFVLMLILLIIAFFLGYYTFAYWHTPKERDMIRDVPINQNLVLQTSPLNAGDISFTRRYIGYVSAIHEAEIQPFISGFIDKIFVRGGEFVHQGDLLIVLDQAQYKAQLDAARADILKAQAVYKNALTYYNRIEKAGTKAISQTEQDNAEAQLLTAQASLEQAKANYALAIVNFDYTIIRAPIDGIIGNITLTPGNYVSPASGALVSIMQYNPIRVVFSITDKEYLNELNKPKPFAGDTISLLLSDGSIFPNKGVFMFSDNAVNRQTNSVAVYADFKNIGKTLTPNAYVTVLIEKIYQNALSISKDYVNLEENGSFVYIIRNGRLLKTDVKILASDNSDFIIADTFAAGDLLVTQSVNVSDINKPAQPAVKQTEI